jgi:hypothetical protein
MAVTLVPYGVSLPIVMIHYDRLKTFSGTRQHHNISATRESQRKAKLRRYPAHCNANSLLEGNFCKEAEVFQISMTRLMK